MIINDVSILNKPLIRYCVGIEKTPRHKIQCLKCAWKSSTYRVHSLLNACRFLSEIMMIGRKNAHNNGNEICHLSLEITTRWEHHKAPHVRFANDFNKRNEPNDKFRIKIYFCCFGMLFGLNSNHFMLWGSLCATAILCTLHIHYTLAPKRFMF